MKAHSFILALLVIVGCPVWVRAEEPAPRVVGLDEVLAAARQAPAYAAARAHSHAAAKAVEAVGGLPPTTMTLGTSRLQARFIAGVQVPLPLFGRLGAARDVARAEHQAARADASKVDLVLFHDVTVAWYGLAHSQSRAELAAAQATRATRLAQVAHHRFDAGDVPRQDAVQADAGAARAVAEAKSEQAQVEAASAGLAMLLGWDPTFSLRARGGLPDRFPSAPSLQFLEARLDFHPALAAVDAQVAAARARVVAASRDQWPQLSLGTELEAFDPTLPGGPELRTMLNLDLPLFGRRSAARDTAEAERTAAQADRASLLSRERGTLVAAYRRYQAAQLQARNFARDVVPAAEDAARLSEVAYQGGQGGLVSVLDAERALADIKREWVDARLTAATALADLQLATGGVW